MQYSCLARDTLSILTRNSPLSSPKRNRNFMETILTILGMIFRMLLIAILGR
jgi:hypothetical protein